MPTSETVKRMARQMCRTFGHEPRGGWCHRCGLWLDPVVLIETIMQRHAKILTR